MQVGCILSLGSCHGIVLSRDGYKRAEVETRKGFFFDFNLHQSPCVHCHRINVFNMDGFEN